MNGAFSSGSFSTQAFSVSAFSFDVQEKRRTSRNRFQKYEIEQRLRKIDQQDLIDIVSILSFVDIDNL